jgi:hypothetical protein
MEDTPGIVFVALGNFEENSEAESFRTRLGGESLG